MSGHARLSTIRMMSPCSDGENPVWSYAGAKKSTKAALKCRIRHFNAGFGFSVPYPLHRSGTMAHHRLIPTWGEEAPRSGSGQSLPSVHAATGEARGFALHLETNMMSATRPAIMAGLLLSGMIASPCALARPSAPPPAPPLVGPFSIAQAEGEFVIRAARKPAARSMPSQQIGATVRMDADLLIRQARPIKEIAR
ncbi:hypothetical protein K3M67_19750 (plasmid) [Sphingobium sp. V4]|uniref:hypothetical protein n=1 Tax=Sphingobium sp. V4 TaxID=3038927 RepID=UPI0025583A3F|nr:hypothetical protein [Sphingobium sp. V4]WIW90281.1 hypothetical protein K3M67_19750 [Sphingobium sp. V4]